MLDVMPKCSDSHVARRLPDSLGLLARKEPYCSSRQRVLKLMVRVGPLPPLDHPRQATCVGYMLWKPFDAPVGRVVSGARSDRKPSGPQHKRHATKLEEERTSFWIPAGRSSGSLLFAWVRSIQAAWSWVMSGRYAVAM